MNDCDAAYWRALDAGASSVTKPTELSFGERVARVRDPQDNIWWIHTRLEEVSPEELKRRGGEKKYVEAMAYVQSSLDAAMASLHDL